MTTTTETATVEVLTAEVRVLQVGRRQITQSIYRQLDRVPPDDIEPFGRVRDPRDDDLIERDRYVAGPFVIGRNARDVRGIPVGALVRADAGTAYQCGVDVDVWRALPLIVLAGLR